MNKRVVLVKPGEIRVEDGPIPEPVPGMALLKVLYGGICGSDLNAYRGANPYVSYPRVPGHELAARVAKVGANPHGVAEGMLATVNPYFNCGKCYPCSAGRVNCCVDNQTMGVQREGGFSEYLLMPTERVYSGEGLEARELALVEPFCISYHGLRRAAVRPGEKVLVIGAGTIGVMAMLAAKGFGAEVHVADISPGKLEHARRLGADGTILNDDPAAFRERAAAATGGDGFAVTVEAVGLPETFQTAVDTVAYSGRVVLIGVSKRRLDFDFTLIQKKELQVLGSRNALREDFRDAVDLLRGGNFSADAVVSAVYDLDDAARAFTDFDKKAAEMLKVLIRFP